MGGAASAPGGSCTDAAAGKAFGAFSRIVGQSAQSAKFLAYYYSRAWGR
jgi:hypothetical protein